MSTELKGKVKLKLWVRSTCTDDSDKHRDRQRARRDFKQHRKEEGAIDVVAPDVFDEAFELGESAAA